MRSTYFITVKTGEDHSPAEYAEKAPLLDQLVQEILTDSSKMRVLTKYVDMESVHLDVEVSMELDEETKGVGMLARTVVDITSEKKVSIDKAKLTRFMRSHALAKNWNSLAVEKRQVTEVAAAESPA